MVYVYILLLSLYVKARLNLLRASVAYCNTFWRELTKRHKSFSHGATSLVKRFIFSLSPKSSVKMSNECVKRRRINDNNISDWPMKSCGQQATPTCKSVKTTLASILLTQSPPQPQRLSEWKKGLITTYFVRREKLSVPNVKTVTPPNPTKTSSSTVPWQQMYLDFGQQNFAKNTLCSQCGMLYVHGVAEDLEQHSKVCSEYLNGVPLVRPWKHERVVWSQTDRIIEVRETDPISHRKKVLNVKRIVDLEMGFVAPTCMVEDDIEETKAILQTLENKKCYLYVSSETHSIVGLCIVEQISSAYFADPSSKQITVSPGPSLQPCSLGIYQLWTHTKHRSKGIATKLVDAARSSFFYGTRVPRTSIAFSSPTQDGMKFASQYSESTQILIYDVKIG